MTASADADEPGNPDVLTYMLGGRDASLFTIDTIDDTRRGSQQGVTETPGQIRVGKDGLVLRL